MDIIAKAEKRLREIEPIEAEGAELRAFLATARKVAAMFDNVATTPPSDSLKPVRDELRKPRVRGERTPPKSGKVYDTAMIVLHYMQEHGEGKRTRELLPFVKGKGMEVGGANEIATLSARLGTSQMFQLRGGQWFIKRAAAGEEAADIPAKDKSTASLFHNQGGHDGTALDN